ncbi:MAG: FliG C-terminal domain-containing protein [bacterium]
MLKKTSYAIGIYALVLVTNLCAINQYQIEQFYTEISQKTLDTLFGKNTFIVKANIELTKSKYQVTYTKQSQIKEAKQTSSQTEKVLLMPGYPALKNISPDNLNTLPYDSVTTLIEPKIKRTILTIFASKEMTRLQVKKINPILQELLNLDLTTDKINIKYKSFFDLKKAKPQPITIKNSRETFTSPDIVINFLLLCTAIAFLLSYLFKNKKESSTTHQNQQPSIHVNPSLELPEGLKTRDAITESQQTSKEKKNYFDFINTENISLLISLLKKERVSFDYVVMILSFIPTPLINQILDSYSLKEQSIIIEKLKEEKQVKAELLKKLETKIQTYIETSIGGPHLLEKIFKLNKISSNKNILDYLEKNNPSLYKDTRPYIRLIKDLDLLEEENLKEILSSINLETLSKGLTQSSEELIEKIKGYLPENGQQMLIEYIASNQANPNTEEIDLAQKAIIKTIRKLEKTKKLDLANRTQK